MSRWVVKASVQRRGEEKEIICRNIRGFWQERGGWGGGWLLAEAPGGVSLTDQATAEKSKKGGSGALGGQTGGTDGEKVKTDAILSYIRGQSTTERVVERDHPLTLALWSGSIWNGAAVHDYHTRLRAHTTTFAISAVSIIPYATR